MPNFIKTLLVVAGVAAGTNQGLILDVAKAIVQMMADLIEAVLITAWNHPFGTNKGPGESAASAFRFFMNQWYNGRTFLDKFFDFDAVWDTALECMTFYITVLILFWGIRMATRFSVEAAAANADLNPIP